MSLVGAEPERSDFVFVGNRYGAHRVTCLTVPDFHRPFDIPCRNISVGSKVHCRRLPGLPWQTRVALDLDDACGLILASSDEMTATSVKVHIQHRLLVRNTRDFCTRSYVPHAGCPVVACRCNNFLLRMQHPRFATLLACQTSTA